MNGENAIVFRRPIIAGVRPPRPSAGLAPGFLPSAVKPKGRPFSQYAAEPSGRRGEWGRPCPGPGGPRRCPWRSQWLRRSRGPRRCSGGGPIGLAVAQAWWRAQAWWWPRPGGGRGGPPAWRWRARWSPGPGGGGRGGPPALAVAGEVVPRPWRWRARWSPGPGGGGRGGPAVPRRRPGGARRWWSRRSGPAALAVAWPCPARWPGGSRRALAVAWPCPARWPGGSRRALVAWPCPARRLWWWPGGPRPGDLGGGPALVVAWWAQAW